MTESDFLTINNNERLTFVVIDVLFYLNDAIMYAPSYEIKYCLFVLFVPLF